MSPHTLTGAGDLAMDWDIGPYIGKEVEFVRYTRGGLAYVRTPDGKMLSVPRRNLEPRPQLTLAKPMPSPVSQERAK